MGAITVSEETTPQLCAESDFQVWKGDAGRGRDGRMRPSSPVASIFCPGVAVTGSFFWTLSSPPRLTAVIASILLAGSNPLMVCRGGIGGSFKFIGNSYPVSRRCKMLYFRDFFFSNLLPADKTTCGWLSAVTPFHKTVCLFACNSHRFVSIGLIAAGCITCLDFHVICFHCRCCECRGVATGGLPWSVMSPFPAGLHGDKRHARFGLYGDSGFLRLFAIPSKGNAFTVGAAVSVTM